MSKDIKELFKMVADMEKRLRFNEARIKVLADTMTASKDIEKYLDVLYAKMGLDMAQSEKTSQKLQDRQFEMSERAQEARDKEREKKWDKESKLRQKEIDQIVKDADKINRDSVRQAEMKLILKRLAAVETLVKTAMK